MSDELPQSYPYCDAGSQQHTSQYPRLGHPDNRVDAVRSSSPPRLVGPSLAVVSATAAAASRGRRQREPHTTKKPRREQQDLAVAAFRETYRGLYGRYGYIADQPTFLPYGPPVKME